MRTFAMGLCTRPWKSTPMPTFGPTASRTVATLWMQRSTLSQESTNCSSAVAFILTAVNPRSTVDGGEPAFDGGPGGGSGLCGPVAADPRVDLDAVADRTAEQVVDRHAVVLAFDVPQGLVDARERAHVDGAAAVEPAAVEHRPDVLDVARVPADQVVGELVDGGGDGGGAALDHGFAPADGAVVGLDAQEQPPRRHRIGGDRPDLHVPGPPSALRRIPPVEPRPRVGRRGADRSVATGGRASVRAAVHPEPSADARLPLWRRTPGRDRPPTPGRDPAPGPRHAQEAAARSPAELAG